MAFVPGTLSDDIIIPTANGGDYRGGGGADTYILSNLIAANAVLTITDTEGGAGGARNKIQLVDGLKITSSKFFANAAELTLSNGAKVQITGASSFDYDLGANVLAGDSTGALAQSFGNFAAALGVATLPTGSASATGTANYEVPPNPPPAVPTFSVAGAAAANEGANASFTVSMTGRATGVAYGVTVGLAGTGGAVAADFGALALDAASTAAGYTFDATTGVDDGVGFYVLN